VTNPRQTFVVSRRTGYVKVATARPILFASSLIDAISGSRSWDKHARGLIGSLFMIVLIMLLLALESAR
jgi:hypothetical protein